MFFYYDEEDNITDIEFENDDLCLNCNRADDCTLIKALQSNLVYPSSATINIRYCDIYV